MVPLLLLLMRAPYRCEGKSQEVVMYSCPFWWVSMCLCSCSVWPGCACVLPGSTETPAAWRRKPGSPLQLGFWIVSGKPQGYFNHFRKGLLLEVWEHQHDPCTVHSTPARPLPKTSSGIRFFAEGAVLKKVLPGIYKVQQISVFLEETGQALYD